MLAALPAQRDFDIMAPVGPAVHHNVASKVKRPIPPGIQTNGNAQSSKASPSPSISSKKPPLSAKQPPHSASERSITASTVRPINRARRENSSQIAGRNSRNSAGLRSASMAADTAAQFAAPPPYIVTDHFILKKFSGRPPSLVIHMHATHFRFDGQDGMFQYKSPMRIFIEHLRKRTVPQDLLPYFNQSGVPFYDGCLIVQVHNHKSSAQPKNVKRPTSTTSTLEPSSIHNYNQCLTPSPFVPYPKESMASADSHTKADPSKEKLSEEKDKESMPAPALPLDDQKNKAGAKPKVYTLVLHPTQESLQMDLHIKAATPRGSTDGRGPLDTPGIGPPSTPMSLVPPTPTTSSMPPPAKRQKKEKMELDGSNIHAAEGQILLATTAPLILEPTSSVEETIALLEIMSHPSHSKSPPQPKARKRTVAEMAADEAAAADHERYMLLLDERLLSSTNGGQNGGATDADAPNGAATFEPRFERFKVIEDIKREHAEKKEAEKAKREENDRRLAQQKAQQAQQEQLAAAQRAQAQQQAQQAAEQEKRREAAAREAQLRQEAAQRNMAAARAAAASNANTQTNQRPNMAQQQHAHPAQNPMANGTATSTMQNSMPAQAQPRFQAQITQPPASSPVPRQGTPQNMSSPMVGSVPMQQTNSNMAASPPRPSSVVQNHPMSVPMAHNMSARGSQQSHPSGTPRMPHSTPNMQHGTPINRPAMVATPRMTQASPPPNMMAQNSQMGQGMMMNNPAMNQPNPMMVQAAQQRALAQQQQMVAMQNGIMNGNMNGNMNGQAMSPQQQQQMVAMMQRQMLMAQQQQVQQQQQQQAQQQQQQQQPQQGGIMNQQLVQQYAQQLQTMQNGQLRQMNPNMQAQLQMRMNQMNGAQMGNPMQRQVSGQMMNGNNINMAALAAMQQQQQQQQQQAQQQQQQAHQVQQPQTQQAQIQMRIQQDARILYQKHIQALTARSGGLENIPQEMIEKIKQQAMAQATSQFQQNLAQRRAAQQQMIAQQQQQQMQQQLQQQQQQAAMQGMGGMMGHQGM